MKIITFNTQGCKNYIERCLDHELMAKVIKDFGADIVGLNEMFTDQTKYLSILTGIENFFFALATRFDGIGPYGNGFLSKIRF